MDVNRVGRISNGVARQEGDAGAGDRPTDGERSVPRVLQHAPYFTNPYYSVAPGRIHMGRSDDYTSIEVPGDGSCLFHAVLVSYFAEKKLRLPVYASPSRLHDTSLKLRERAVDYVVRHYDTALGEGFEKGKDLIMLEYGSSEDESRGPPIQNLSQYGEQMRRPTTFGGNTEIVALSQVLRSNIVVVQEGVADQKFLFPEPDTTIHVRFDPRSEHYTPLVRNAYAAVRIKSPRDAPWTVRH